VRLFLEKRIKNRFLGFDDAANTDKSIELIELLRFK